MGGDGGDQSSAGLKQTNQTLCCYQVSSTALSSSLTCCSKFSLQNYLDLRDDYSDLWPRLKCQKWKWTLDYYGCRASGSGQTVTGRTMKSHKMFVTFIFHPRRSSDWVSDRDDGFWTELPKSFTENGFRQEWELIETPGGQIKAKLLWRLFICSPVLS